MEFFDRLTSDGFVSPDWVLLFSWDYLTSKYPSTDFIYQEWGFIFAILSIIGGVGVTRFILPWIKDQKPKVKLLSRISNFWVANSVFLALYLFMRQESVEYLSMRLFLVIILLVYAFLILYTLLMLTFIIPKRMVGYREAVKKNRYLPKKKK